MSKAVNKVVPYDWRTSFLISPLILLSVRSWCIRSWIAFVPVRKKTWSGKRLHIRCLKYCSLRRDKQAGNRLCYKLEDILKQYKLDIQRIVVSVRSERQLKLTYDQVYYSSFMFKFTFLYFHKLCARFFKHSLVAYHRRRRLWKEEIPVPALRHRGIVTSTPMARSQLNSIVRGMRRHGRGKMAEMEGDQRRALGRPCMRWEDELKKACGRLGRTSIMWMRETIEGDEERVRAMGAAREPWHDSNPLIPTINCKIVACP